MTDNKYIPIYECADILGMDRSHLLKDIKAGEYGHIKIIKQRDRKKQNQKVSAISKDDFEVIRNAREMEGFGATNIVKSEIQGVFYIVQTDPMYKPNRYKFGFSTDLANRLQSYKAVCPELKLIHKWKCDSMHEAPLLKMITKYGKRVGQELFEVDDIEKLIGDINQVIQKMAC